VAQVWLVKVEAGWRMIEWIAKNGLHLGSIAFDDNTVAQLA
jgi:hypothetical protein